MATPESSANVSAQLVKELRERTGAGFSACKDALLEAKGDLENAVTVLRKKGQAAAQKSRSGPPPKDWSEATFMPAGRSAYCWS